MTCIRLDRLEVDRPQISVLNLSDSLCRRVVHNMVLVLYHVPLMPDAQRLHGRDEALPAVTDLQNRVVDPDLILLLTLELESEGVFLLLLEEHPFVAKTIVEHLLEIGRLRRVDVVESDPVLVENAPQHYQAVLYLEVLELVKVVARAVTLHLDEAVLGFEDDRLVQLEHFPMLGSLLRVSQLLINPTELLPLEVLLEVLFVTVHLF